MQFPELLDLCPLIALLASGYCAALIGSGIAHLVRGVSRFRKLPSSVVRTAACGFLPLITLVAFIVTTAFQIHSGIMEHGGFHDRWHEMADFVHAVPGFHLFLHLLNLGLVFAALCGLIRAIYITARAQAFSADLSRIALAPRVIHGHEVHLLPTDSAYCFAVGILRPRIYVAEKLLAELPPRETEAMVAHEAAHIKRRDNLMLAALTTLNCLIPLPGARILLADWSAAAERACDEDAACTVGSRCDVAAALVNVASLSHRSRVNGRIPANCFTPPNSGAEDVEGRVHALLAPPTHVGPFDVTALHVVLAIGACLTAALCPYLRHLAELFSYH
jgi:Zn-dependent protease with chaperone function